MMQNCFFHVGSCSVEYEINSPPFQFSRARIIRTFFCNDTENNDNGVTTTCELVLVHQKLSAIWQSGKKILEKKANCIVQQQPKSENSCAAQAHSTSSKLHNNHKWLPGEHSEERNMYELHEHVYEHHGHCIGNMCDF